MIMLNLKSTRVHFLMILIIVLVGFTIFLVHFYHSPEVMMLDEPFWSKEFRTALLLSLIITIPMIVEVLIDGFSLIIAKEAEIINWIIRLVLIISHNVPILLLLDKSLRRDCSAPASLHTIAFINHAFLACICMSLCQDHQNLGIGPVCIVASIMHGVGVYTGCCYIFNKSSISIVSVISIITAYLLFTYIFGKYTINLFRRYKKWDCNDIHYLAYFSGFLLLSIGSITIASSFKYELTHLSVSLQINLTSLFLLIITTLPCQISKYNLRRLLRRMIEKEAFIRYISHEIRTPLNTVFLGLNFIKEELLGVAPLVSETVEPILETVTEVNNCCQIALSIVNDLLTFDKLEEGKMSLELIETDIQRYVSETIKLFDIPAREKRISIEVAAKDEEMGWLSSLVLRVDQHKMSQVIRNIISNAIKFTPDDGKISVTMSLVKFQIDGKNHNEGKILNNHRSRTHLPTKLKSSSHDCMESSFDNSRTGNIRRQSKLMMNKIRGRAAPTDYLRIEVKDSGVGISLENQNVLFGQYVQFNASKLQHGNGSGLGLYISKGITELHGGWIGAYSDGEGKGSTFFVELPLFSKEMVSFVTSLKVVTSSSPVRYEARKGSHSVRSVGTHPKTNVLMNSPGISYSDVLSLDRKIRYRSNSETFNFNIDVCQSRQISQSTVVDIYPDPVDCMERDGDEDRSSKNSCRYFSPSLSKASSVKSVRSGKLSIFNAGSIRRVGCDSCTSGETEMGYMKGKQKPVPLSGPVLKPRDTPPNIILNSTGGVKVLIVDDSISTRKVLSKLLLKKGYEVQCAEDGLICLDLVAQSCAGKGFDVILMDDYMPNLAGRETAKILRERGYKGFICGVTGNTNLEDNLAYEAYGANAVLPKPLDIALFEKIVNTHMKNDFILKELTETLCL